MKPWEQCPNVWKTEAKFYSWLRGQIRRIWSKHPVKLEYIKSVRRPLTQKEKDSGRFHASTKNVIDCRACNASFKASDIQVDHIIGEHSCRDIGQAKAFLEAMAFCSFEDLQALCKECHRIKTYSERYGKTLEEAKAKIKELNKKRGKA